VGAPFAAEQSFVYAPTAVEGGAPVQPVAVHVVPNPFAGSTALHVSMASGPVLVVVLDAAGRMVRAWREDSQAPSERVIAWDGRDRSGREAPAGIYTVRVAGARSSVSGTLIKLR